MKGFLAEFLVVSYTSAFSSRMITGFGSVLVQDLVEVSILTVSSVRQTLELGTLSCVIVSISPVRPRRAWFPSGGTALLCPKSLGLGNDDIVSTREPSRFAETDRLERGPCSNELVLARRREVDSWNTAVSELPRVASGLAWETWKSSIAWTLLRLDFAKALMTILARRNSKDSKISN